jgi:hypothetical protein
MLYANYIITESTLNDLKQAFENNASVSWSWIFAIKERKRFCQRMMVANSLLFAVFPFVDVVLTEHKPPNVFDMFFRNSLLKRCVR